MTDKAKILVVDDHPSNIKALRTRLAKDGHQVVEATSGAEALEVFQREEPDLVLLDIMMPGMDGYEVCRRLKEKQASDFVPIIMVTALTETDALVRGLAAGADEYVTKPFDAVELMARVGSMLRIRRLYQENTYLRQEIAGRHRFGSLIGESRAMQQVMQRVDRVAQAERTTVLIQGESGTGKELIARAVHE